MSASSDRRPPSERFAVPPLEIPIPGDEPPLRLTYFRGDPSLPRTDPNWEPFQPAPLPDPLTDERRELALQVARANPKVQELLGKARHIALGVRLYATPKAVALADAPLLVLFYNYTEDMVVEALLDSRAETVTSVAATRYQPPPVKAEIDRAIELARSDPRLGPYVKDGMYGAVMPQEVVDPRSPQYAHRLLHVMFTYPDERGPRYRAMVDLSVEAVLGVDRPDDRT